MIIEQAHSAAEWNRYLNECRRPNLMQAWEYGEAKADLSSWSVERHVFKSGGRFAGLAQVFVREVPFIGRLLAWVNRGPLCAAGDGEGDVDVARMLGELRGLYAISQGAYLRVAPPLVGDAESVSPFRIDGFTHSERLGWASSLIDLSQPIDCLRRNLDKKWRNCLSKAEKQDIKVEWLTDEASVEEFAGDYAQDQKIRGYSTRVTPDLVRRLRRSFRDNPPAVIRASRNGTRLGSVLMVRYADRAEYLAGVIGGEGRNLYAGQLLLWNAVTGFAGVCKYLDLGGMHPTRTPAGIFHFKAGLGGAPYSYINELEAKNSLVSKAFSRVCGCLGV
jgi:peptidoglycan pentaglycine glycine transferase (the first glycine)